MSKPKSVLTPTPTLISDTASTLKPEIDFRNMVQVILARLEIKQLENGVSYGLIEPMVWEPTLQKYIILTTQDLRVEAKDFSTAKQIFWPKFKNYVKRRTGKYIPVEITAIDRINVTSPINRTDPDQVNAANKSLQHL